MRFHRHDGRSIQPRTFSPTDLTGPPRDFSIAHCENTIILRRVDADLGGGCYEINCYSSFPGSVLFYTLTRSSAFYEGKTAKIIAGFAAGSVDDAWSRMLARYMGKHIAGTTELYRGRICPAAVRDDCRQLRLRRRQTDGLTLAVHSRRALLRSAGAAQGKCNSTGANFLARQVRRSPIK